MKKIFYKSPTILSCIGVVITSVYASKATLKADKLLKDAENSKGEKLTKIETVKIVVPTYAVPVIFGASTIACILGSNVLKEIDDEVIDSVIRENCSYHQINSDIPDKKMRIYIF